MSSSRSYAPQTEELLEARRAVVVGSPAQRDAEVLELSLDRVQRGLIARTKELRAARQYELGEVVAVTGAVSVQDIGVAQVR